MAPLAHARADRGAGLEDQRLDVAIDEVRGRRETDWTGSYDSYGKLCGTLHGRLLVGIEDFRYLFETQERRHINFFRLPFAA